MDKHRRFSVGLVTLFCALLVGSAAAAGPRKAPTSARGLGVGKNAVGKLNYKDWSGWKTPSVAFEIKIAKGSARLARGETLITASFEQQSPDVGGDSFTRGVVVTVPELGTVSPLSATIWSIVKMPPVKTANHGVVDFAHKQQGPLRIRISSDIVEKMDELKSVNPKLSRAQQLRQIIHENDQGDVYDTLSKLGYKAASLDVVSDLVVFEYNTGYRTDYYLVADQKSKAKKPKAKTAAE